MRKRLVLLLSFILALTVLLALFAGCGEVTVNIPATLELVVGKSSTLTASTSDGSEVVWSSADESVATVNDKGRVTGQKAGKTQITATAANGKGFAVCEVTVKDPVKFTFKDDKGDDIGEKLKVDRNGEPVRISAVASDGSAINRWSSNDEKIVTVENGIITAVASEGEATITVATNTGSGTLKVEAYDTFQGTRYTVTNTASKTEWYYWAEHTEYTTILKNEARYNEVKNDQGETTDFIGGVTFGFDGGNWNYYSIRLMWEIQPWEYEQAPILYFKANIEADFEGTINLNGTRVHLKEGENKVQVRFVPAAHGVCLIEFGTAKDGTIEKGTITISNWQYWQEVDYDTYDAPLATPSFELDNDGNITITDNNPEEIQKYGIEEYKLALFRNENDTDPAFVQVLNGTEGKLDVTKFEETGDYYVKLMAVGNPFYTDSAWAVREEKYTVGEHPVDYDLPFGGASDAIAGSGWYYYTVDNAGTEPEVAHYTDGTLSFSTGYLGWAFYSTELIRHYPTFGKGAELLISMNVKASHPGTVTISDTVVELAEGDNQIYVKTTQSNKATVVIMFGKYVYNGENDFGIVDFPVDVLLEFELSEISVTYYQAVYLEPVGGEIDAANKKITVNNPNENGVKSYELGFFKNGTLMKMLTLDKDGKFDDAALNDDTYELRLRAVAADVRYVAAGWTVIGNYEVANGGATYKVNFGGDGDSPNAKSDLNTWYYWNDQQWTGSSVVVNSAEVVKGVFTIDYTVEWGGSPYGLQLYYRNPSVGTGDKKLTLKIDSNSDAEIQVTINGAKCTLGKGVNELTVYYSQGGGDSYTYSMQVVIDADVFTENVLKIYDLEYEAYTYKTLAAPEIEDISEEDVITITDGNESANVGSYVLGYFKTGGANPVAKITVASGDKLDYSMLNSGNYIIRIMAVAADNKGYRNSGWSAGYEYEVVNEGGARYELETGFGAGDANNNPGRWGVWAGKWDWTGWGSNAEASGSFANDEVTIKFTLEGGANGNAWGLQINYVNPNYAAGTTYWFDIVADKDMYIQVESGGSKAIQLKAGEKVTLEGGTDATFYIQVNIGANEKIEDATLIISNLQWK